MEIGEAIEKRRSIRRFKDQPLMDGQLRELLEAARQAPSGSNTQPWRFAVLRDEAGRRKMQELANGQKFVGRGGAVIVCCADMDAFAGASRRRRMLELMETVKLDRRLLDSYSEAETAMTEEERRAMLPYAMLNLALAVENICLKAVSMGLGTCIVHWIQKDGIARYLELPENIAVGGVLAVGVPDETPEARPRLPLNRLMLDTPQNDFHPK